MMIITITTQIALFAIREILANSLSPCIPKPTGLGSGGFSSVDILLRLLLKSVLSSDELQTLMRRSKVETTEMGPEPSFRFRALRPTPESA